MDQQNNQMQITQILDEAYVQKQSESIRIYEDRFQNFIGFSRKVRLNKKPMVVRDQILEPGTTFFRVGSEDSTFLAIKAGYLYKYLGRKEDYLLFTYVKENEVEKEISIEYGDNVNCYYTVKIEEEKDGVIDKLSISYLRKAKYIIPDIFYATYNDYMARKKKPKRPAEKEISGIKDDKDGISTVQIQPKSASEARRIEKLCRASCQRTRSKAFIKAMDFFLELDPYNNDQLKQAVEYSKNEKRGYHCAFEHDEIEDSDFIEAINQALKYYNEIRPELTTIIMEINNERKARKTIETITNKLNKYKL